MVATITSLSDRSQRAHNLLRVDKEQGYRFVERDPEMEWVCNAITDSGMTPGEIIKAIYDVSNGTVNLHYTTIEKWLDGKTKRPQNYTLTWVAKALGYDRVWTKQKRRK